MAKKAAMAPAFAPAADKEENGIARAAMKRASCAEPGLKKKKRASAQDAAPPSPQASCAGRGLRKKRVSAQDAALSAEKHVKLTAVFCDEIATLSGVTAKEAKEVMGAMRQVMARELREKGRVKLNGFVLLRLKHTPERPAKLCVPKSAKKIQTHPPQLENHNSQYKTKTKGTQRAGYGTLKHR